ncbi:MAG: hypothetical protein AB8V23_01030 [Candidatus Midichloria sp.]
MSFLSLDGTNGFTINGIGAGNIAGAAVGRLGDVNGDNKSDIILERLKLILLLGRYI